ncbi:WD40 repeat domain-containing protein [Streptomyces canus]|uniref:WD40 repeat domain-containing protein n=1 Tax=Streptomyces canus TaxID=58343 RepID=UPI0027889745|nr:WD40 repeat domain-containing protein [Streptomyces canus]MDQ0765364.1 WD40 repeat protein/energy-coupling factor transporter ATP-binding protein EcfA2 [Streptomyces canus]
MPSPKVPPNSGSNPDPLKPVLLAAGTAHYDCGDYDDLTKVPGSLQTVVEALADFKVQPFTEERLHWVDPGLNELEQTVGAAARAHPLVIVYYTGHGVHPERDHYFLVLKESNPADYGHSALRAIDLPRLLMRTDRHGTPDAEQPEVLLIIDCCFAGGAAEEIGDELQHCGNDRLWVLASASRMEFAEQGRFANALAEALKWPLVGVSAPYVGLDSLSYAVNEILGTAEQTTLPFPPLRKGGLAPFFRNVGYHPGIGGLTVSAQNHWISKLHGAPEATTGFYLTGRAGRIQATTDLLGWMSAGGPGGGLAVVTGSPGSGKSTLLALPAQLSSPAARRRLLGPDGATDNTLVARAAELVPLRAPLIAVHGHGLNADQVAQEIAERLEREANGAAELLQHLTANPETEEWAVLVDAVDEAVDPVQLLEALLVPLARRYGLRVVLGTRQSLLTRIGPADLLIDLDRAPYLDHEALVDYIRELLLAAHEPHTTTPYQSAADEIVDAVAAELADRATTAADDSRRAESFLVGQLLARSTRGQNKLANLADEGWRKALPSTLGRAFEEDLARVTTAPEAARTLLRALAFANGPGLPWENIWVPVAQALAGSPEGEGVTNDDIRLLQKQAGAYIVEDLGPGNRSVFRPIHHELTAHLRGEPSGEAQTVTDALLATVPTTSDGRRLWASAHPYVLTYLPRHASDVGPATLAALTRESDLLAVADPVTLTPLLSPAVAELNEAARVYRRARPLLGQSLEFNAACLQEAALALGSSLASRPGALHPTYRTRLAAISSDNSLLAFTSPGTSGSVIAFGAAPDGRLLLATGNTNIVQVLNARTGAFEQTITTSSQLSGPPTETTALAFGVSSDGRLRLAVATGECTVQLWDPETRTLLADPATVYCPVTALAFTRVPGGRLLLAGAAGSVVTLWDGVNGALLKRLTGGKNLTDIAVEAAPNGRLRVAGASIDPQQGSRKIVFWDVDLRGRSSHIDPATQREFSEDVLAIGTTAEGQLVCVCHDEHGTFRLRDAADATALGRAVDSTEAGWVPPVAFGATPDGRCLLAYQTYNTEIQLRDLRSGEMTREPLSGHHDGGLRALAFGCALDGEVLLASSGVDDTVRLWDTLGGVLSDTETSGGLAPVGLVALGGAPDGQAHLAFRDGDHAVRVGDLRDGGTPSIRPFPDEQCDSVALGTGSGGHHFLGAALSWEGMVRLWDVNTSNPVDPAPPPAQMSLRCQTATNGRLLLECKNNQEREYRDPLTGERVGRIFVNRPLPPVASFDSSVPTEERLLLVDMDKHDIKVRDASTGASIRRTTGRGWLSTAALGTTSDGRILLAASTAVGESPEHSHGAPVLLWDLRADPHRPPNALAAHDLQVHALAFGALPDGTPFLASGGEDLTIRFWDPVAPRPLAVLHRRSPIRCLAALGTLLAVGDDEGVSVLELDADFLFAGRAASERPRERRRLRRRVQR